MARQLVRDLVPQECQRPNLYHATCSSLIKFELYPSPRPPLSRTVEAIFNFISNHELVIHPWRTQDKLDPGRLGEAANKRHQRFITGFVPPPAASFGLLDGLELWSSRVTIRAMGGPSWMVRYCGFFIDMRGCPRDRRCPCAYFLSTKLSEAVCNNRNLQFVLHSPGQRIAMAWEVLR